jgi:hypothetical protein
MIAYAWSVFDGRLVVGERPIPAMGALRDVDRIVDRLGRGQTVIVAAAVQKEVAARLISYGIEVAALGDESRGAGLPGDAAGRAKG